MKNFYLTGNEEDSTYTYQLEFSNAKYKFWTSLTKNHEEDFDYFEESFIFDTYRFTAGKQIDKINKSDCDITIDFVKAFACDLKDHDYCFIYDFNRLKSIVL